MIGGAEWYVHNISRELVRAGIEVTVFTANRYGEKEAPPEGTIDGVKVRRFPLRLDLSYRLKLWDGLHEALLKDEFDIIHTYDYAQRHSLDALRAASKNGTGSALTVFDVHSAIPRAWYKRAPMRYLDSYFARRTFPLATRILVRAPNLVEQLPGLNGCQEKVRVTPSGVRDESFGTFDGEKFREKYSIRGSPLVLFVGRLNPLKGPQFLLRAAVRLTNEFPEISFVFVGPDQSGYRSVLQGKARELGLSSRVCFTGMISDFEEKMEAYSACDVFVLPTSYEGTSQAIFEAMSQGKPVVATRTGGIPFQVSDGEEGFLVKYGDVDALAERVARVLREKGLASDMSIRARTKAESFRYSKLSEALLVTYEEILNSVGN
jgi:glycosyltransferase involved in cell wall biosynthesis